MNNKFPNASVSFNIEMNEDVKDFFIRMINESKSRDQAVRSRIMQLFNEHVRIDMQDDMDADDAIIAYNQLVELFAIGYQCGWNDRNSLCKK